MTPRDTIDELRAALNDLLADLERIASDCRREVQELEALIARSRATLLRTLPGGEEQAPWESRPDRAAALKVAQWEAYHTGPYNWSGKEVPPKK